MVSRHLRLLASAVSVIALFNATSVRSQDQEGERRVVLVDVLDQQGHHVAGLSAANFKATFRGQPVRIVSVTEDTTPRRIAIVVDVSASQAEAPLRGWSQAEQLIDSLIPQRTVALYTVASAPKKHTDFTNDRDALQRAMRDGRSDGPAGASSLYDGVAQAALGFPDARPGDAICLFSDGVDTSSTRSIDATVRSLTGKGVRLFLVGTVPDRRTGFRGAEPAWRTITNATGGWMAWIDPAKKNPGEMTRVTQEMLARITSTIESTSSSCAQSIGLVSGHSRLRIREGVR